MQKITRCALLFLFVLCTLVVFNGASVLAAVPKNAPTNSFTSEPVPNQIIVKYKKDLSPQALQLKVDERKAQQSQFFGSFRLFFDNLSYRFNKQALPEEHLTRIQTADKKVGAKNKTRIFDAGDENQRNIFVIETDGTKTIEETIRIYEAVPEVEYAEPNYVYSAF